MTRVLVSAACWREFGARIAAAAPVTPVLFEPGRDAPDVSGVEAAFLSRDLFAGGTRDRLNPAFLAFLEAAAGAPGLRWLHIFSAGADLWAYGPIRARGIRLTTSAGASAPVVAQAALAGLLALARQFPRCLAAQRRRAWEPLYGPGAPRDLGRQSALVVGTGPIGQEIGRLLKALGLATTGVRRNPDGQPPPGFDAAIGFDRFHDALPRTDWLVLACPLTDTTRGLVDGRAFSLLRPGACLVNVARGPVVVEAAMLAALEDGRLGGAMLDVFAQEPLPAESPFWDLPNVIITPHSAAASDGTARAVADAFIANLRRWQAGEALRNEA